jgi:hypothetical protein
MVCSWCYVLCIPCFNHAYVGCCATCVPWCGMYRIYCIQHLFSNQFSQVFYGRYLKRLSNQTQEALGEMTKVHT